MRRKWTVIAGAVALSACGQPAQLWTDHGWVRLSAVKGQPAAGYLVIHGGPTDRTLVNVSTEIAINTEMHDTMANGMHRIDQLAIPAHKTVKFAPGGRHIMLYDVNPGIKPGSKITFTLSFADGTRIQQDAAVIGAGDPPPK